jgi:hypothetical protein
MFGSFLPIVPTRDSVALVAKRQVNTR